MFFLCSVVSACAGSRTIAIESTPHARVLDGSQLACETTPCAWTFSRETCFGYDSSKGWFRLVARAPDGRELASPPLKTCALKRGTRLSFRFASNAGADDCLVTVTEKGQESRYPGCGQPNSRGRRKP